MCVDGLCLAKGWRSDADLASDARYFKMSADLGYLNWMRNYAIELIFEDWSGR
jgi:hypothetical protein